MSRAYRSSSSSGKQLSGGCAVLFGLPFILAGVAVGLLGYLWPIASWWSARGWAEVPCWIEKAELKASHGTKGGTTFHAAALYRYEFDRHQYHSEKVRFYDGSDRKGGFEEKVYQQIKEYEGKARPFRCYVNPALPEEAVLFRDLRWGQLLMISIFPTLFPLAGFTVSVSGWLQARRARQMARLAAQHPDAPWRWRSEWSGDAVQAMADGLPYILGIAGWILLVQLPLALAVTVGGEIAQSAKALLALLPSLLALIPLSFAWQRVKSRRILGHPTLKLGQLPVSPGQALAGELRFDREPSTLGTVSVQVLCQRQITRRSGSSNTTAKETIWEHTETLATFLARRDIDGVALPLRIAIPRGLPCSAVDETTIVTIAGEQHVWTLTIRSSQGGKPVVLPLPVFASAAMPATTGVVEAVEKDADEDGITLSTPDLVARLKARGLQAEFDPGGAPIFIDCPAGRFRGLGIFLLFFGAFWSAAFLFMVMQDAPWLFRVVWGITSPLILGTGIWTLLHSRRIEITADKLRILNRVGPFYSWNETFEKHQVTGFVCDSNMQSGNQFFYRVRAETIFGKPKTVIDGITESVTAQVLVRRLEEWRGR
ncbi:DUF3592 domain-containing protein [Prosthecobacter sp.]|uniref:DUF3592 domain-containing protein n=1 Tax=Prosthecobacter sp. TaxID=1965333 RepID=UPI0037844200